jgi:hypothetical protein
VKAAQRLAALLLACGLFAACESSPALDALSDTASKLNRIKSGVLTLRLLASSRGLSRSTVGFELQGPFSLPKPGALPVADMAYSQIRGQQQRRARFISTGQKAFVQVGGTVYELTPQQTAPLRAPAAGPGANPLVVLGIDDWVIDPRLSTGGTVEGQAVERVRGRLDAAAAINGLLDLARQLGSPDAAAVPRITGPAETQLARAIRSSTFEVLTNTSNHYLRRLRMTIEFGATAPPSLRPAIQTLADVSVSFELDLNSPNRSFSVAEPQGAVPYSKRKPRP